MTEALLTVTEVAQLWRCHPRTVRREISRGNLEQTYVGGLLRIAESSLDKYRRNNTRARKAGRL